LDVGNFEGNFGPVKNFGTELSPGPSPGSTTIGNAMALTDTAIRLARPRERVYRLNDDRGLCILIQTNGAKW
jgi:hypothetical protein